MAPPPIKRWRHISSVGFRTLRVCLSLNPTSVKARRALSPPPCPMATGSTSPPTGGPWEVYEKAAAATGFIEIRWTAPTDSTAGVNEHGLDH